MASETDRAVETRRRLLDESERLIGERGLDGLSLREMARRANVSHQAPYHHFGNREGLLAAIMLEGFTELDARLVTALEAGGTPPETLRRVLLGYMRFALDHPVRFRLMFRPDAVRLSDWPQAYAVSRLTFKRLVDAVGACHPRPAQDGERFTQVVHALWSAAHGVAILALDGPLHALSPNLQIDAFVETAAGLFSQAGAAADV